MKKKDSDIFEGIRQGSLSSDNFFVAGEFSINKTHSAKLSEPSRRLNDYDFKLLEEDAYKDVGNELFKLEYKMHKLEKDIAEINSQIASALEIRDFNLTQNLINFKKNLENEYELISQTYSEKSLSGKITDKISNLLGYKLKKYFAVINNKMRIFVSFISNIMPQNITTFFSLKNSINKLECLNDSVDKLVSSNVPYGENVNKYEQLSKYIIKANSIQAEISKQIKK